MRVRVVRRLVAVAWCGLLLLGAGPGAPQGRPAEVDLRPAPAKAAHEETRCGVCHTPAGWTGAGFAHDRTAFPLRGAHPRAPCKACHVQGIGAPLSATCGSCHREAHQGDFGQRCEGCHNEASWRTSFTADAHRRTAFPLVGRHALLPCTECHFQTKDRRFSRETVECIGCHERDYARTALGDLDHAALGFGTSCRSCHGPWRFTGALFPAHNACFLINAGEHAGVACRSCHTTLAGATVSGTCATGTAACSGCHEHTCSKADEDHTSVPGYQCKDRKCYECHRFSTGR